MKIGVRLLLGSEKFRLHQLMYISGQTLGAVDRTGLMRHIHIPKVNELK